VATHPAELPSTEYVDVTVGFTTGPPLLNVYEFAPEGLSVNDPPLQSVPFAIVRVRAFCTCTVAIAGEADTHPPAPVPVTANVAVTAGLTTGFPEE
jgi:hypothetical protein